MGMQVRVLPVAFTTEDGSRCVVASTIELVNMASAEHLRHSIDVHLAGAVVGVATNLLPIFDN